MTVAMMVDNPAGSEELYAALRAEMRFDGPFGGAVHIAGPSPKGGWRDRDLRVVGSRKPVSHRAVRAPLAALGYTGAAPAAIPASPRLPDHRPRRDRNLNKQVCVVV